MAKGGWIGIAKFLAAEAGFQAADVALQTHGGFGYANEYHGHPSLTPLPPRP